MQLKGSFDAEIGSVKRGGNLQTARIVNGKTNVATERVFTNDDFAKFRIFDNHLG